MCRCLQSCFESLYWNCVEKRFLFDESIARYGDEEWEKKCYTNYNGNFDNVEPITHQPTNNNHLPLDSNRAVLTELPILAPDIYKVFSKSMIFKDDEEVQKYNKNEEKIHSKITYNGHIGKIEQLKKVVEEKESEEDENEEHKYSDFEIMFQDELYKDHMDHAIFKIEEEEEEDSGSAKSPDAGIMMKSAIESEDTITPTVSISSAIDKPIEKPFEMSKHLIRAESSKSICRANSLRASPVIKSLPRTDSAASFTRVNSKQDLLKRVDSMKALENKNFKNVLARVPQKSASFLCIPDLLQEQENKDKKEGTLKTISSSVDLRRTEEHSQISRMPDTPVIIGGKFPKFFAETPVIGEYKAEINSLTPKVLFQESDYSMPRYYGRAKTIATINLEDLASNSKSLPDLHEASGDKVSKRLSKLGSKLKPLIIKKHDDSTKHHPQI